MLNMSDVKEAIQKFQTNYRYELTDLQLEKMAKLWHDKIKYWTPNDLNEVISHLIENRDYMPKISHLFSTYKKLGLWNKLKKMKISYRCNLCKDTGVRAFIGDNIIQAGACGCPDGQAIKLNNMAIPWIENMLVAEGIKEYPLHTAKGSFMGSLPKGVGFRLSKEVAGKNNFMYGLTEKVKNGEIKISSAVSTIKDEMEPEELPF